MHNFYRKFQNRNARRSSGGIVLYYKDTLENGIEIVRNILVTIIWLELKKNFFHLKTDMYLRGLRLMGKDSPAYNVVNTDLCEMLMSIID